VDGKSSRTQASSGAPDMPIAAVIQPSCELLMNSEVDGLIVTQHARNLNYDPIACGGARPHAT